MNHLNWVRMRFSKPNGGVPDEKADKENKKYSAFRHGGHRRDHPA